MLSSQSSWWNEKCAQKMLGGDCGQWDRGWWGLRPVGTERLVGTVAGGDSGGEKSAGGSGSGRHGAEHS